MLLARVVEASADVTATASRTAKLARIAACLRELAPDERAIGARILAGEQPHKTGVGYAMLASTVAARAGGRRRS